MFSENSLSGEKRKGKRKGIRPEKHGLKVYRAQAGKKCKVEKKAERRGGAAKKSIDRGEE